MESNYDFSKAEKGKFYRPIEELKIPIYLERNLGDFYTQKSNQHNMDLNALVNLILRKEMEILKKVG